MPVLEIVEQESDEGCVELRCGQIRAYGYALPDALAELKEQLDKRQAQRALGFPPTSHRASPRQVKALGGEA